MLEELVKKQTESIVDNLTYTVNDKGEKSSIGNAIREILKNNEEQSSALKSFTTDLALKVVDDALAELVEKNMLPSIEKIEKKTVFTTDYYSIFYR